MNITSRFHRMFWSIRWIICAKVAKKNEETKETFGVLKVFQ